jgi:hypothetical protein
MGLTGYRTIIAAAVALVGALLKQTGLDIDDDGITTTVMTIAGAGAAMYYRWKATTNLQSGGPLH